MIACAECLRLAVPDQGDLAAEDHDPGIEVMRMSFTRMACRLPTMHDFEAFPAQIALECLTCEPPAIATTS